MILQGNQRGGAKNLALHLLKDENEHVDVHEIRGFVSDNLVSALNEAHAMSKATKARQFLFSLSLNPPPNESVSTPDFLSAIERVEGELGLGGQPRAIVFHEKEGRRHCHAVWSRIDVHAMKAIHLPYTKRKLMEVSRALYLEHGWTMPKGFMSAQERDPDNFTLAQWQQAKRTGKDPRAIKQALRECWAVSDGQGAFEQALKAHGFVLAKGDRRGFVVVDAACEIYSLSKWSGLRSKEIKARIADNSHLPSADEAKKDMALRMAARLNALEASGQAAIQRREQDIERQREKLVTCQQQERAALVRAQQKRRQVETTARQARFSHGLKGLWDRLSGARRKIEAQNRYETYEAEKRDQTELDVLITSHLQDRQKLQRRIERLRGFQRKHAERQREDIRQYEQISDDEREQFEWQRNKPNRER